MAPISAILFVTAILLYGASSVLFFVQVARQRPLRSHPATSLQPRTDRESRSRTELAPLMLGLAALLHAAYVTIASFVAHVCPVRSVHFPLSIAALLSIAIYLSMRRRYRIDALGIVVGPLSFAFLLGTYFVSTSYAEPRLSPMFIFTHVLSLLLGMALFLLASGSAALYLVQENRLKTKRIGSGFALPPLDTLDEAVHRFLILGFPLLTIGILSGTFWAPQLEFGNAEQVMRIILGYASWLLLAAVLLMRVTLGWRGRKAAYGTLLGFTCILLVLTLYIVRPAATMAGAQAGGLL